MGVIDTLTAGFNLVIRKPWLLLIPLLLDLALLAAPKVTILPVFDEVAARVQEMEAQSGAAAGVSATTASTAEQLDSLRPLIGEYNLMSLLSVSRVALPSIAALRPVDVEHDRVISLDTAGEAVGTALVVIGLGLFAACVYWTLLAQQARQERNSLTDLVHQLPVFWLRTMAAVGIMVALLIGLAAVGIFLIFVAQLFSVVGLGGLSSMVAYFILSAIWIFVLWLLFYTFYVPVAITLTEAGPIAALQQSVIVVRASFRQSLGLFALVNVISTGLGYLWSLLMGSTGGTVAAIVANAFVGTGLMAAVFIFYRDRVVALHHAQQLARS